MGSAGRQSRMIRGEDQLVGAGAAAPAGFVAITLARGEFLKQDLGQPAEVGAVDVLGDDRLFALDAMEASQLLGVRTSSGHSAATVPLRGEKAATWT